MKKVRPVVARNAKELAKVLGLPPADGMEIEFRSDLNDKIIEVVAKKGLTHVGKVGTRRGLRINKVGSGLMRFCDSSLQRPSADARSSPPAFSSRASCSGCVAMSDHRR